MLCALSLFLLRGINVGKQGFSRFAVLLMVLFSPIAWADVQLLAVSDTFGDNAIIMDLEITGTIDKGDSEAFATRLRAFSDHKQFVRVTLNSAGGNIEEALRVGRQIRDVRGYVFVPVGAECASSCVFLLAAGMVRGVNGKVGIHRPFNPEGQDSNEAEIKALYKDLKIAAEAFLGEMNVSVRLYEDMLRIPPHSMRYLTREELHHYGLLGSDPVMEEIVAAESAAKAGISREELARREAEVERVCGGINDALINNEAYMRRYGPCYDAIMAGKPWP